MEDLANFLRNPFLPRVRTKEHCSHGMYFLIASDQFFVYYGKEKAGESLDCTRRDNRYGNGQQIVFFCEGQL